jgi:hypothetical protein
VADRSPRTVAIVTLALVAPLFAPPRAAMAETAIVDGVAPVVGFAIFDFGRTDKLRAKLAQSERRQAAAEWRARTAEESAQREHAAFKAEHAAREREHIAYKRELAKLAAYRKQSDAQRDRLARLKAQNAGKRMTPALLAALSSPHKRPSASFHPAPKPSVAAPRSPLTKPHPAGTASNRSVGWGAI